MPKEHTGFKHTAATKAKMSASHKGKKLSEETKSKMSVARKGKKLSTEHIEKSAKGHIGIKPSVEARDKMSAAKKGKKLSAEHVEKVSKANTGLKRTAETKAKISTNARGWMSPRAGRSKWYELTKPDGTTFKVQGTYELRYAKHLLKLGIVDFVAQPKPGLKYIDQFGGTRTYNPDFWVPSLNSFVEIKSSYTISMRGAKRKLELVQQAGHPLIILTETEMKEMGIDFSEKHPELA